MGAGALVREAIGIWIRRWISHSTRSSVIMILLARPLSLSFLLCFSLSPKLLELQPSRKASAQKLNYKSTLRRKGKYTLSPSHTHTHTHTVLCSFNLVACVCGIWRNPQKRKRGKCLCTVRLNCLRLQYKYSIFLIKKSKYINIYVCVCVCVFKFVYL